MDFHGKTRFGFQYCESFHHIISTQRYISCCCCCCFLTGAIYNIFRDHHPDCTTSTRKLFTLYRQEGLSSNGQVVLAQLKAALLNFAYIRSEHPPGPSRCVLIVSTTQTGRWEETRRPPKRTLSTKWTSTRNVNSNAWLENRWCSNVPCRTCIR